MRLAGLQRQLEHIYRLDALPNVEDFLISTKELQAHHPSCGITPQVLLISDPVELKIAVHLGDAVEKAVADKHPSQWPLPWFCIVCEEVSHFLYLCWRSLNEQPVSLLDLELQGEIDKALLAAHHHGHEHQLFARLFDHVSFRPQQNDEEVERYQKANRLAARFISYLGVLQWPQSTGRILKTLRAFYRLRTTQRLQRLSGK